MKVFHPYVQHSVEIIRKAVKKLGLLRLGAQSDLMPRMVEANVSIKRGYIEFLE